MTARAGLLLLAASSSACLGGWFSGPLSNDEHDDSAQQPDLGIHPDLAAPVDLAPPADLTPPPDLAPRPPDMFLSCPSARPLDCSPGSGTGTGAQCFDAPSCYLPKVQNAVRKTINDNPTWFDTNNSYGCAVILDVDSYMSSVVANLVADGLCAIRDPNAPGEEVTVKHDNAWSENFDIVASTGCARYGGLIYTSMCSPAWW